ncbi:hypothetical protein WA026_003976 [Henosepilachna vigintioctopunctata]|uniref:Uncharacterized protein n=1 Tax=Henosepilachna vigintioctopunctata TaxID=420089 RepID=A0AAW1U666_9CUCU
MRLSWIGCEIKNNAKRRYVAGSGRAVWNTEHTISSVELAFSPQTWDFARLKLEWTTDRTEEEREKRRSERAPDHLRIRVPAMSHELNNENGQGIAT